jgi:hypothetical protein
MILLAFIQFGQPDLLKMDFDATRHLGAVRENYHESDLSMANKFLSEVTVSAVNSLSIM